MQSRSARLRFEPDVAVEAPSAADRVDVAVVPEVGGAGWLGQLSISGTTSLRREVVGVRCQDVVAALALITVLRFEGDDAAASRGMAPTGAGGAASSPAGAADRARAAGAAPDTGAAPSSTTPVAAAAQPTTGRVDASTTSPRGAAPAEQDERTAGGAPVRVEAPPAASGAGERSRTTQSDVVRPPEPPPEVAEAGSRLSEESAGSEPAGSEPASSEPAGDGTIRSSAPWRWPVMEPRVFGSLGYASVPSHAFKAALGGELRFGEGASGWVGALSLAYARGDHANAYGRLALTLLTLELQLCPQGVALNGSVWLRACGQLRGGGINLSISPGELPVVPEDAKWRPWAAFGAGLAAGFPLTERLELRGLFELAVQLVRDRFEVARLGSEGSAEGGATDTLYRPEALSLELGLGLGFAF